MTIKQNGGIFGRNPTFNEVDATDITTESLSLLKNNPFVRLDDSDTDNNGEFRLDNTSVRIEADKDNAVANSKIKFKIDNSEVGQFNTTGDLLIAKTGQDVDTDGIELRADGVFVATADGASPIFANRRSSDGAIATFMRSGSTVGSIKCRSSGGNLQIDTGESGIDFGGDGYLPMRNGTITDNSLDIGSASFRYQDIYATNGTIQTSDRNEKQDIEELSEAERRVAVAAKGLLRKFRWQSAVSEKGDNARIHFGIIAQDLQAAFTAEGLDAGDYGMFISTTWWEHTVEVPAVEAVDKVTETSVDEEGNETVTVITPAVEARDAYTLKEAYETAEEAPEGSVQKTRLGVRYPELLAFIIAAT